jgi:hypothetical protein
MLEAVNRRRTDDTMAQSKRTINNLQNTTQKTIDRTLTPLIGGDELRCFGRESSSGTHRVTHVLFFNVK